jgi:hypothetical protein
MIGKTARIPRSVAQGRHRLRRRCPELLQRSVTAAVVTTTAQIADALHPRCDPRALAPTRGLLEECAAGCGSGAAVVDAPCLQAWALFEGGDHASYHALIARHVRRLADDVDVVVLAQASMAPAGAFLQDLAIPVLSSLRLAVLRAAKIAMALA